MKLVLATGIYPPDHGGPATFIPLLANRACDTGSTVSVVTLSDELTGHPTESWAVHRIKRKSNLPIRIVRTIRSIKRSLKDSDLLFSNGLLIESYFASLSSSKPWIVKFVGDPSWERYRNRSNDETTLTEFDSSVLGLSERFGRYLLHRALRRCDLVITPSRELEDLLKRWGVKNVKFIPNGVDIQIVSNSTPHYDVVTVSRLVSWKNVDVLIRACGAIGATLVIIGDGPLRADLERLVANNHLDHLVSFAGSMDHDSVRGMISKARVFALLSSYEGMSFALLEAMAECRPVLVGDNDGNRLVIRDGANGLVVGARDERAVSQALHRLLTDRALATSMAGAALQTVRERFDINRTLDETIHLMRALLT